MLVKLFTSTAAKAFTKRLLQWSPETIVVGEILNEVKNSTSMTVLNGTIVKKNQKPMVKRPRKSSDAKNKSKEVFSLLISKTGLRLMDMLMDFHPWTRSVLDRGEEF